MCLRPGSRRLRSSHLGLGLRESSGCGPGGGMLGPPHPLPAPPGSGERPRGWGKAVSSRRPVGMMMGLVVSHRATEISTRVGVCVQESAMYVQAYTRYIHGRYISHQYLYLYITYYFNIHILSISSNHRIPQVGRDPLASLSPAPCSYMQI